VPITKKQVNDIARINIASIFLLGNGFNAENLSIEDNGKVNKALHEISMRLLRQTEVGETATSDFEAVEKVLNYKK